MIDTEFYIERECSDARSWFRFEEGDSVGPNSAYDPHQTSENELLVAQQLIEDAAQRDITVTLADLGIRGVRSFEQSDQSTAQVPSETPIMPTGIFGQVVVQ